MNNSFKRRIESCYRAIIALLLAMIVIFAGVGTLRVEAAPNDQSSGAKESESKTSESANYTANGAVEILNYDLKGVVSKDHSYKITQKITAKLPADTKSIEFEIPSGNFRINDLKVENTAYEADTASEINVVKIVEPKKLTEGVHTYTIEYVIREFADRDSTKDMFYLSVLLPSWSLPINKINITLDFPDDFPWADMQCYSGQFGVQDLSNKVVFKADAASKRVRITGERIPENFGISVKDRLPDGYWEGALDGIWALEFSLMMMGALLILMLIMWFIGGKDPKLKKELQDHPVEGITPVEVGYIFTGRIHTRDLVCLLVYMATKGYLHISEYRPKRYRLIRKNSPENEEKFIRNAYDVLFDDVDVDRAVEMEDIGTRMRKMLAVIESDVAAGFSGKDMVAYTGLSKALRVISSVLFGIAMAGCSALTYLYQYKDVNIAEAAVVGILTVVTSTILCRQFDRQYYSESKSYKRDVLLATMLFGLVPLGVCVKMAVQTGFYLVAVIIFVLSGLCEFFIVIMRCRAKGNAALVSKYLQLKKFIYHPTPLEVAKNYREDKNYYYEMVPYALMFKGMETWAISFLTMNVAEPDWYSDDIEGHAQSVVRTDNKTLDFAKDIKAFYRTMIDSYRTMVRRHRKG